MEESLEKDLYSLFNKFKKCKNIFNYEELLLTLDAYKEIISEQELNIEIPKQFEYEENKFQNRLNSFYQKDNKFFINNFKNTYDYNKKFINGLIGLLDKYIISYNFYLYRVNLSEEKIIELVKDFYYYYDKDIHNYFEYMLNNNRVFFTKDIKEIPNGNYTYGYQEILPYINVDKTNTVNDVFVLTHETMHGYVDKILNSNSDKEKRKLFYNNIDELYPKFIELVILGYLKDIGFNRIDLNTYKKDNDDSLLEEIEGFSYYIDEDMKDVENQKSFHEIENYLYSQVIAYHLYERYLNNNDKTKEDIKDLIMDSKYYDREELLDKYNFPINVIKNKKFLTKHLYKRI